RTIDMPSLVPVAETLLACMTPFIAAPAAQDVRRFRFQQLFDEFTSSQSDERAGEVFGLRSLPCPHRQLLGQLPKLLGRWYPCHRSGPTRCVPFGVLSYLRWSSRPRAFYSQIEPSPMLIGCTSRLGRGHVRTVV